MNERLLTLDTSGRAGSIAFSDGETLLGEQFCNGPGTHSDWLLPAIEQLSSGLELSLTSLAAIAVVVGPGSFTGLRVGIATAKGLAIALGLPLVGVSSLQTLAAGLPWAERPVCTLLDARKQEVYACLFRPGISGEPEPLGEERVLPPEQLLPSLPSEVLLAGDGALRYRELLAGHLGAGGRFAPDGCHHPRAGVAAGLALRKLRRNEALSPALLSPHYLRPSEAEIAWSKRSAGL